jgi:adenylate cyclase
MQGPVTGFVPVVVVTIIVSLLAASAIPNGPFDLAQGWLFDVYQQLWPPQRTASRTVLVEINDEAIHRIGQWPWPRDTLAELITDAQQAKAIGVDVLMAEADRLSPDRLIEQRHIEAPDLRRALQTLPHPDEQLAAALRPLPTVLAVSAGDDLNGPPGSPGVTPVRERGHGGRAALLHASGASWPLPILAGAAQGLGIVTAPRDRSGEIVALPTVVQVGGSLLPSFGIELLRIALGTSSIVVDERSEGVSAVSIGRLTVATDASGGIRPRFVGASRLVTVGAGELLDHRADQSMLRDRIVLIGVTASGVGETFRIPLGTQETSAAIQAEMIESVLAGDTLWRPWWAGTVEGIAGAVLGLTAWLLGRLRYRTYAIGLGSVALLLVGGSIVAFRGHGVLLDWIFPSVCLFMTAFGALTMRVGAEVTARRQREVELKIALVQGAAAERENALSAEADTLRQSLALAVDAAALGVWHADLQQGVWHHSPRHDEILGLTTPPAHWSTEVLLDRVAPEDHATVASRLAEAKATGTLHVECRIKWRSARCTMFRWSAVSGRTHRARSHAWLA